MNKQIQTIIIKSAAKQTQLSNLINSTVILSQETEVQISTSQGILTLHNTWTEDEGAIYSHYTYNKRTIKYTKPQPKPTQPKEKPNMYTKSQLSKLKKADLIQIILDNQFTIPQPTKETSQPTTIITPQSKPITQPEPTQPTKPQPKFQSYKPTPEQANIIGAYYLKHSDQFPSHIKSPKEFTSLEEYTQHLYNKPIPTTIIEYLTNKPKRKALNMDHLKYTKAKDLTQTIQSLPTNTDFIYLNKTFNSTAALHAEIKNQRIIYGIANQLHKQFPSLSIQTLITRMSNSDLTPQQYKTKVLQLIAAKSKTFSDCPVNLFKQHLAEYKLYLHNLNQ